MADSKITSLTELSSAPATSDVLPIVDVSDTSQAATGTTKKIRITNLLSEYMKGSNNLSDVANASTSRTNLGVAIGSDVASYTDTRFPAGADIVDTDMSSSADVMQDAIEFIIDGGGSAITTGVKGDIEIPYNCTITRATLLADQTGSIVVDIWKDTYANFPPTNTDSITASAKPTLSSASKAQDTTLTGWTTTLAAGSTLRFNVDSVSTVTRVTVSLKVTKT